MSTLLTREQIAERVGVTPTTIYRWEKRGISPVTPIRLMRTNQLRYPEEAVAKLLAFKEETAPAVIGRPA